MLFVFRNPFLQKKKKKGKRKKKRKKKKKKKRRRKSKNECGMWGSSSRPLALKLQAISLVRLWFTKSGSDYTGISQGMSVIHGRWNWRMLTVRLCVIFCLGLRLRFHLEIFVYQKDVSWYHQMWQSHKTCCRTLTHPRWCLQQDILWITER